MEVESYDKVTFPQQADKNLNCKFEIATKTTK